ncbi:phosphotransferase enzyme family protein [Melanomma pulvis-pyrius CBS 109.77]|uniref:Phosphotransferase enzyme family protein n=1 Tax=Melanomma pulvis-pyrius CBS 109.77 TaxID=1314802 RepID=A0A6A6XW47_9PLEO|nr:phosphotransferase enzyme family protein [Melanomma pulvis-pyrius CBS 109.77]
MSTKPPTPLVNLPNGAQTEMNFLESTWFKTHGLTREFPSPEEVHALAPKENLVPVKFVDLDLVVKFEPNVSTSEAIRELPVPEMILSRLRTLRQNESEQAIGSLSHSPSLDQVLEFRSLLRPFLTVASFHDWLSWLWCRHDPDPQSVPDVWRQELPDNVPIVITHGDLHRSNIIVTATSPTRVLAVIDWEQAGWGPDYWEYCKAKVTAHYNKDWRGWIDVFLEPHPSALEAFNWYADTPGAL